MELNKIDFKVVYDCFHLYKSLRCRFDHMSLVLDGFLKNKEFYNRWNKKRISERWMFIHWVVVPGAHFTGLSRI